MELKDLIPASLRPETKASILMWEMIMNEKVDFWQFGSEIHTKKHCGRVLLFAEMIADDMSLPDADRDALAIASIFHDSRRKMDGPDVGHGRRAADYYKSVYDSDAFMLPLPYDPRAYLAMAYHDRDDSIGNQAIRDYYAKDASTADTDSALRIYHIFKDSDALDRFRLGLADGLDVKYLRTESARKYVPFAKQTVIKSMDGDVPADIAELIARYDKTKD